MAPSNLENGYIPRGYRSATEFRFDKEQTDAIIRTTAYHRKDYCLSVIWFSHREHNDIHPSIATPFRRTSRVGLGSLDQLPLELLFDTLYRLDMHSLFKFRQINLRSRQIVDSLNPYQRVVSHGLTFSAPCYEHGSPSTSLYSTFIRHYVPRHALFAANSPDLYPYWLGNDAVLNASRSLRRRKCGLLPLSESNYT
jgi:hypothetical protein